MKLSYFLLPVLVCFAGCGPSKPTASQVQYLEDPPPQFPLVSGTAGADDIGRFLAGLPVRRGAVLSRFQQSVEYQAHQNEMGDLWRHLGHYRVQRIRAWSESELAPAIGGSGTVLYPFGGPDLLYASAMFPQARTYALMGLEPVGDVPALESMQPGEVLATLAAYRQITRTPMDAGYYITKDMRSNLRGVTPILLSAVALTGGQTDSVRSISAGGKPAVEVRFRDASGMQHTAIYVCGDLSNGSFNGGYRQWLAGLGGNVTYFKAASYLMHEDSFSQAREFFLTHSHAILQDDAGIPFRYFAQGWSLRFYGNYEHPIGLFASHQQEDLRQAYATNPKSPLNFGSGYHVNQSEANLLLAIRR